eukprot:CAMPEP_0202354632 /NCGR_PEP_ID=MMETSP1126-20121109/9869_1 /ASSEMBLY_ACC=CAM_ASM_000457 /TAXON_ID=3047 /ORGANISM="Dunaliella tertiolecta, Strain CCMP1320" /LENGTH=156 /DNA_ID=CAMNT_0048947127 /DNA_START=180 /DNA_END=646 /DNA_ORIENTATION=-
MHGGCLRLLSTLGPPRQGETCPAEPGRGGRLRCASAKVDSGSCEGNTACCCQCPPPQDPECWVRLVGKEASIWADMSLLAPALLLLLLDGCFKSDWVGGSHKAEVRVEKALVGALQLVFLQVQLLPPPFQLLREAELHDRLQAVANPQVVWQLGPA